MVYVGVRDVDPPEAAYMREHHMVLVPPCDAPETLAQRLSAALAGFTAAYIHVDLDVLDPSAFPHTCCPTAGGISLRALLRAIDTVGRETDVVGCGLTECCGDPTSHASELAAVVDALAAVLEASAERRLRADSGPAGEG